LEKDNNTTLWSILLKFQDGLSVAISGLFNCLAKYNSIGIVIYVNIITSINPQAQVLGVQEQVHSGQGPYCESQKIPLVPMGVLVGNHSECPLSKNEIS
jgi:hypothetical protein